MRYARIVRIEWDDKNEPYISLATIRYALKKHLGFTVYVYGSDPSFEVKEER